MQPILIFYSGDSPNRYAPYVAEMLRVEGLNWLEEGEALPEDAPRVVIACAEGGDEREAERLAAYVRAGGSLLACRPSAALLDALGMPPAPALPEEWADRYVLLEATSAVVQGLPWAESGIQFFGRLIALPVNPNEPDSNNRAEVPTYAGEGPREAMKGRGPVPGSARALGGRAEGAVARIAPFPGQPSRFAAVTSHTVGSGRVILFAFDPAESIVRQQQGRPAQASIGALPDFDADTTYRPNDLFFGQLDFALRDTPQADLQRTLFLRCIEWLTEANPLPRLWRFPDNAPAAALFDGDSDSMDLQDFRNVIEVCDRYGAPFGTYVMRESIKILPAEEEAKTRARGHTFGPHPWAGPRPTVSELREALNANCDEFAAAYGYRPRIHRGHWLVWPGYVDHARSLQQAGIELDANFTAGWGFKGGYVNGTGLPARFLDEAGRLLDVYEQSTISTDDGWLTPKGGLPAMTLAEAISRSTNLIDAAVDRWHTVYHPYFHPRPIKGGGAIPYPTRPWLDSVLAHARRRGIPYLNPEKWLDWNAARRAVTLADGGALRSERAIEGLTVLIPTSGEDENTVIRHGRRYVARTVTLRAGETLNVRTAES